MSAASAADSAVANCANSSRTEAPVSRAAAAPVTVWLAGDSTMANPGSARCPVGWGSQFDSLFNNDVTVKNQAVGGRSIGGAFVRATPGPTWSPVPAGHR